MPVTNTILAIASLLDLLVGVNEAISSFQTVVGRAQREGRDLTPEEVAEFEASYRKAFDRLQQTP